MKSKTHGHYFANMEFIGRDIRVDVRYVKFDNTVDGKTGSGWVASVDDKPLSNMFDFSATASYSKRMVFLTITPNCFFKHTILFL